MPQQAKLDSPGMFHYVMIRGIEGRRIVDDEQDEAILCAGWASWPWLRVLTHAEARMHATSPQADKADESSELSRRRARKTAHL